MEQAVNGTKLVRGELERRTAIRLLVAGGAAIVGMLSGCQVSGVNAMSAPPTPRDPLADAAEFADPSKPCWDDADLNLFLAALPDAQLWSIWIALGLAEPNDPVPSSISRPDTIVAIHKRVVWLSSNILTWPFKDKVMHYDALVRWVGKKYGVAAANLSASTFKVEQEVMVRLFAGIWDKLTPDQRAEVLAKMDPHGALGDHAGMVTASGTVAAATLATSALLTGFAFYTSMSAFLSSVAALVGVTLPMGVYTGASALIGFLSGPVGWVVIGVGALVSVAWMGAANEQKCAAFVLQVNALRAASWRAAGRNLP